MINEKKDACYHKVKSRYSVWPSAYASGALVKCRKKGAKNWGKGRKDEALHTAYFNFAVSLLERDELGDPTMGALKNPGPKPRMTIDPATGKLVSKTKSGSTKMKPYADGDRPKPDAEAVKRNQSSETPLLRGRNRKEAKRDAAAILQKERDRQAARNAITTGNPKTADRRGPGRPAPGSPEEAEAIQKRTADDPEALLKGRKARRVADFKDSEARAQAASRGSYRRKRTVKSADLNPETGRIDLTLDKEGRARALARGTAEKIVDRTPGMAAKALTYPFTSSAMSAAKSIANTRKSFMRGRQKTIQQRRRIDFSTEYQKIGAILAEASAAWTRSEGKNPSGGLNAKGVASYRAKNPGSKLKTAVTTKPSKLKKGSKAANRRKSFCARMSGMRKRQKSSNNTGKDRLSLSLKKWNC